MRLFLRRLKNQLFYEFSLVQIMTPNPDCVSEDISIVDALHAMHDGKFHHLPVVDKGENNPAKIGK